MKRRILVLSLLLLTLSGFAQTASDFQEAANNGDPQMQFNLAVCYFSGNYGVEKDLAKAIYWFSEAANNGLAQAQYNLGYFYMNGIGVDIDEAKAIEWYIKAANQENVSAQYNLGDYYVNNENGRDITKAIYWFTKAKDNGEEDAQEELDKIFITQNNGKNFVVYDTPGYILTWPFPEYWIGDMAYAKSIGQVAIFYFRNYSINSSIAHFGINFGSSITEMSISKYALQDINQFSKNIGNDYVSEPVNWNIHRNDDVEIIIYRLYSDNKTMYQYCAYMKTGIQKYLVAYIQLNTESSLNESFINDFKNFLETVKIHEGNIE
jgi:hypothetical protein